jgi:hypothetical protein
MDPAGSKPSLADRETFTLSLEHVFLWHPHIVEINLSVPFPIVVVKTRRFRVTVTPGASSGTTIIDC